MNTHSNHTNTQTLIWLYMGTKRNFDMVYTKASKRKHTKFHPLFVTYVHFKSLIHASTSSLYTVISPLITSKARNKTNNWQIHQPLSLTPIFENHINDIGTHLGTPQCSKNFPWLHHNTCATQCQCIFWLIPDILISTNIGPSPKNRNKNTAIYSLNSHVALTRTCHQYDNAKLK